jgi:hypothetical protein
LWRSTRAILARFVEADTLGLHLALNIFVATSVLWLILRRGANTSPIWAIASMVAVSDPQMYLAYQNFRGRILNTLLGSTVGLTFLLVGGSNAWKLPVAMSAIVLCDPGAVELAHRAHHNRPHNRVRLDAAFENQWRGSRRLQGGRGHSGVHRRNPGCMAHGPDLASAASGKIRCRESAYWYSPPSGRSGSRLHNSPPQPRL